MDKKFKFYKKTLVLEEVQREFNQHILEIINRLELETRKKLEEFKPRLDQESYFLIEDEIWSNIRELQLSVRTIIVNFQRITGLKLKMTDSGIYEESGSRLKKLKLFFLLESSTSEVYGHKLLYLQEELKRVITSFQSDILSLFRELDKREDLEGEVVRISNEYFRLNSDMNVLIDDINQSIDQVYSSISVLRDRNISVAFLLISAFLSLILFFPEFNNMINLKNAELSLEEKLDDLIYDKLMDEMTLEELLDLKKHKEQGLVGGRLEDDLVREIVLSKLDEENREMLVERNRIKVFIKILLLIMIPFTVWIIFISI